MVNQVNCCNVFTKINRHKIHTVKYTAQWCRSVVLISTFALYYRSLYRYILCMNYCVKAKCFLH